MKKMKSLYKRTFSGQVITIHNELSPGTEWVLNGEGDATEKMDGTCCRIEDNILYKRYDRKLKKKVIKKNKDNKNFYPLLSDFKTPPDGWEPCEKSFDPYTFHWPGWLEVDPTLPENKFHIDAFEFCVFDGYMHAAYKPYKDGTYELIGPKVQGNPHNTAIHMLLVHGHRALSDVPTSLESLRNYFNYNIIEGVVWHHKNDGRMVKIKRSDFGYEWPIRR